MPINFSNYSIYFVTTTLDDSTEPHTVKNYEQVRASVKQNYIRSGNVGQYDQIATLNIVIERETEPRAGYDRIKYNNREYRISNVQKSMIFPNQYILTCIEDQSA